MLITIVVHYCGVTSHSLTSTVDHVMDKRKTFMDVHQTLDWVSALSKVWLSEGFMCPGLISHLTGHNFMAIVTCRVASVIYLSLNLENQCFRILGIFSLLAVLGIKWILVVLVLKRDSSKMIGYQWRCCWAIGWMWSADEQLDDPRRRQ